MISIGWNLFREGRRPHRLRHRRTGRRQHGLRSAGAGISRRPAPSHRAIWRASDLRRSHDGFPLEPRRSATAVRHHARSDHARQNHRRRFADCGVWRPCRHHEESRAGRPGLSGRNAFRQSAGRHRRNRHAARTSKSIPKSTTCSRRVPASIVENPPAGVHVNRVGSMFTFFFQPGPVRNYEEAKTLRYRARSAGFSTTFSIAAFTSRHRSSKRRLFRRRTTPARHCIKRSALFTVSETFLFPMETKRRVLVTGAAKRIGRVIAIELSKRGFAVAIHYNLSRPKPKRSSKECGGAPIFQADLGQR